MFDRVMRQKQIEVIVARAIPRDLYGRWTLMLICGFVWRSLDSALASITQISFRFSGNTTGVCNQEDAKFSLQSVEITPLGTLWPTIREILITDLLFLF